MKALLLENIHPVATRILTDRGIEVETVKGALDESELVDAVLAATGRGRWPAYRDLVPSAVGA